MKTSSHKRTTTSVFVMLLLFSSGPLSRSRGDILASKDIDFRRLAGTWYEIARLPNKREEGLVNITTTFRLLGRDRIEVINRGHKESPDGEAVTLKLTARLPQPHEPASLTVRYCGFFRFTYNVLELDTAEYQYAMISGNTREDLWLFSRTPAMDDAVVDKLVSAARADGYDVSELIWCPQDHAPLAAKPLTPAPTAF
jgi:lipocalin